MKIVDLRCCSTCPHGDRCTLPPGHDTGHNHADCPCNEPDVSSDGEVSAVLAYDSSGEHIAQFFAFGHLPPHLQAVSAPFAALAAGIVRDLPRNPERTVALRKLLEAKDAAVRALVAK